MADVQQAIRRLSIQATTSGVTDATRQLNDLARAQGGVAVASASTEKATESLDKKFAAIEKRYISSVRAQADFEKTQRMVNAAVAQNPALQERANIILLAARERHDQLSKSQKAMATASSELNTQLQAAASSFGAAGSALAALGPAGIAAAAALGLVTVGFKQAADAALALADRAGKLKDFSETTGFTVVQLQALEKAGAQVGVSSESVTRGLERFSVAMDDVKKGTSPVFESILEINPALAQQMKQVTSLTEAWDVFSRAIKQSDLEQANKLARSVFGRSGVEITRLARANTDAGGLGGLTSQLKEVDRITAEQAERWDTLGDKIAENMKAAKQNFAAVFTEPVLNALLTFSNGLLEVSRVAREFKMSEEMRLMFKLISAAASTLPAVGAGIGAVTGWMGRSAGAAPAPSGLSFTDRWGDTSTGPAVNIDTARLEHQKRSLAQLVAEQERWAAAMGAAVTPAQQLKLSLDKVRLAQLENKISAEQAAKATGVLNAQFSEQQFSAYIGGLGQAVTVEDQVRQKRDQLNAAMRQGAKYTQEQIAFQLQYTRESAIGITQIKAAADAERVRADTLLMGKESAIAYEIVQSKINEARAKGAPLTEREVASLTREAEAYARVKVETDRYAEAVAFAKDSAQQFTSTLVQGLMSGKSVMESLSSAAKQLASSLADSAIKSLFSGDFVGAAIKGVAAIGAAVLGNATEQDKSLEEARKRFAEMTDQVTAFNRAAAGFDIGPLTSELEDLRRVHDTLALAALEARDLAALNQIHETLNRGIRRVFGEWMNGIPVLGDLSQKIQDLRNEAQGLKDVIPEAAAAIDQGLIARIRQVTEDAERGLQADINSAMGLDWLNEAGAAIAKFNDLAGKVDSSLLNTWFVVNAQKIIDGSQLTGEAFQTLVDTLAQAVPGIAESLHEFSEAIQRTAADIAKAKQSFSDQLFVLQQDQNTLAGSLAVFDLQAQRQREEEIKAGGQALAELEALQAMQRYNIIKSYNDKAIADQQRAADAQKRALEEAQQAFNGFVRNINDFINHYLSSDQGGLSPADQLANAQSAFQTQLALAQGGDRNALNSITQYFQDLVTANRGYNASSSAGAAIEANALAALQALPAQISPEQFIVNAIEAQTTDLVSSLDIVRAAVLTGDAATIATALVPHFNALLNPTTGLLNQAQLETKLNLPNNSLDKIFKELDGNGDGLLEKSELIKVATQGVKTGTDHLPDVDTNTDSLPQQATKISGMETSLLALAQVSSNTASTANISAQVSAHTLALRQMMQLQNSAWGVQQLTPLAGFAMGTDFAPGGLAIVGERGPEVVDLPRGSRVIPNHVAFNDNNGALIEEVRALRAEVKRNTQVAASGHRGQIEAAQEGNQSLRQMADKQRLAGSRGRAA